MKTLATILVMMCLMLEGYTQSSRREANANSNSRTRTEQAKTKSTSSTMNRSSRTNNDRNRSAAPRTSTQSRTTNREATVRTRNDDNSRKSSSYSRATEPNRSTSTNRTVNRERTVVTRNESRPRQTPNNNRNTTVTRTENRSNHSSPAVVNRNSDRRYIESSRQYRGTRTVYRHVHNPKPKSYRVVHYSYKTPKRYSRVVWTRHVHYNFCKWYPEIRFTWYPSGHRLSLVSAYYADHHIGDVASVYGRVKEVFYSRETDEYILYFGEYYPYHDFSIVVPGYIARSYSRRPAYFFRHQNLVATGLITVYDNSPEIVVKHSDQIDFYL